MTDTTPEAVERLTGPDAESADNLRNLVEATARIDAMRDGAILAAAEQEDHEK